jgi:hypothetical protein
VTRLHPLSALVGAMVGALEAALAEEDAEVGRKRIARLRTSRRRHPWVASPRESTRPEAERDRGDAERSIRSA